MSLCVFPCRLAAVGTFAPLHRTSRLSVLTCRCSGLCPVAQGSAPHCRKLFICGALFRMTLRLTSQILYTIFLHMSRHLARKRSSYKKREGRKKKSRPKEQTRRFQTRKNGARRESRSKLPTRSKTSHTRRGKTSHSRRGKTAHSRRGRKTSQTTRGKTFHSRRKKTFHTGGRNATQGDRSRHKTVQKNRLAGGKNKKIHAKIPCADRGAVPKKRKKLGSKKRSRKTD